VGVATFTTSALSVKTHSIKATYAGDATFKTSSGRLVQVVDPYPTTTTLSTSLNPANFGEAVQLTAGVSNTSGSNIPSRNVKFLNGATVLGTGSLDSTGTATLSTTKLPVGSNSITAEYEGHAENGKSTSSVLTQVVNPAQITMSLSALPNPQAPGKLVKFTATLTSNGGLPNGQQVTFSYGTTTLGTANIAAGEAVFSTSTLSLGSDVVTANYAGNADYSAASASTPVPANPCS
jgi:large repetitive protein